MRCVSVRMVFEAQRHCGSQWEAIASAAHKLGSSPETVRTWVRRTEVDSGGRPGLTSDKRERLRRLERENRELRRVNESFKSESAFLRPSSTAGHDDGLLTRIGTVSGWSRSAGRCSSPRRRIGPPRAGHLSARSRRDADLRAEIARVHAENLHRFGC